MKLKVISKESNYIVLRTEDDFNVVLVPGANLCDPLDWKEGDEVTITVEPEKQPISRLWRDKRNNLMFLGDHPTYGYCIFKLGAREFEHCGYGPDWRDLTQDMTPLTTTEFRDV